MRIKICGLSRGEDIASANELMPEYIGFVFGKSRRQVTVEQAAALKKMLDPRIRAVGVFVNELPEKVISICRQGVIDIVQLHGDESEAYVQRIKNETKCPVIKAVRVDSALPEKLPQNADFLLFDTYSDTAFGGTGKSFDWGITKGLEKPFFLAGGINAENLLEACKTEAMCVDISGGAERDGVKNRDLMKKLIDIARSGRE